MSAPNGHANADCAATSGQPLSAVLNMPSVPQFKAGEVKELAAALEVPFAPDLIEWRVTNTTKNQHPVRGQVIPYTDQRAYTDRLNALFTPAGWTRKYTIHTSANFERSKDQKIAAKVLITCELTIFGLGSHSATGEEWADNDNAGTSAEAQAFKRACACFGLGRYLYYFTGTWVDLDDRKRPKTVPKLTSWATPEGWRRGLRPRRQEEAAVSGLEAKSMVGNNGRKDQEGNGSQSSSNGLVCEIEALQEALGRGIYRGLLKTVAHAWKPTQIQDATMLQKVLTHMRAAERGLQRLTAALGRIGPESLDPILRSLQLKSLDQVDNLETLREIVVAAESKAGSMPHGA